MIVVQLVGGLLVSLTLLGVIVVAVGCGALALWSYLGLRHDQAVEKEELVRRLSDVGSSAQRH